MGRGSGKRATRKRVADVSAAAREDEAKLQRATTRRLAKLEKDLAAAHKTEERHRSRLTTASAEADRIRGEIAGLLRHASEPAVGGARKVGQAAADLLEDAADAVADAAGGVVHAAGSVVEAARRSVRPKPATTAAGPADAPADPSRAAAVKAARPGKPATAKAGRPAEGPRSLPHRSPGRRSRPRRPSPGRSSVQSRARRAPGRLPRPHRDSKTPDRARPSPGPVCAAVDVGANSAHLLVGSVDGHHVVPLIDESALLGLGTLVDARGLIPPDARGPLIATLAGYAAAARGLSAERIAFVGTEPLRRAADARAVVVAVEDATGVPLHVLDHREEGLLTLLGATSGRAVEADLLVVDIGGGSTQLVIVGPGAGRARLGSGSAARVSPRCT